MINNIQKRFLLFLLGCMVIRFAFAFIVKKYPNYAKYFTPLALIFAVSSLILYFGDYRKTGWEVFGDKVWWNNLRPVHGLLYLVFIGLSFYKDSVAHVPLFVDAIIGLVAFLGYHYKSGNFSLLL